MAVYDKQKRGEMIAWGGDHFVFDYDTDKVVKFSVIEFLLGAKGIEKAEYDLAMCKKYLGDYALDTEFLTNSVGKYVAKTQPKLIGRVLTKADLHDDVLKEQLRDIVRGYHAMVREEGIEVDLLGRHGIMTGTLTNIFVTDDHRLRIIDTTLLEVKTVSILVPILYVLRLIIRARQDTIIARLLFT